MPTDTIKERPRPKKKKKKVGSRVTKDLKSSVTSEQKQSKVLEALSTALLSNKYTRRVLADQSVRFFAQYYFGITLGRHQERWVKKLVHVKKGMVLAPCGHGKTEIFSKILILWLVTRNRNIRVLLVSKSDGLAVKNLKAIRWELETNDKLIQDFGRFYDSAGGTWSDHQLYCIRDKNQKDPTIEAVGLLGAITGGRFDVIVLDDVLDSLNTRSEDQRLKIQDYIDGTLIPRLEPWGVMWGIGTRKHFDDFYAHCIRNKAWVVIRDRAIIQEPDSYEIIESDEALVLEDSLGERHETYFRVVITSEDKGECLWPEKWTMENLLLLRYTIGSYVFTREYQNEISSNELALFKIEWLQQCRDYGLSYVHGNLRQKDDRSKFVFLAQGTDASLVDSKEAAEKGDSDYTVISSWGITEDSTGRKFVLLDFFRERGMSPAKVEGSIEKEYWRFTPDYHFIEVNSFTTIHTHNLINKRGLNLTKHYTDRKKNDLYVGVPGMAVKFENDLVRLPYKTSEDQAKTDKFIMEFHGLGTEKHDDIVMSTWVAWVGIDRVLKGYARVDRSVVRVNKPARAGRSIRKVTNVREN
jgi:hypothetical protein